MKKVILFLTVLIVMLGLFAALEYTQEPAEYLQETAETTPTPEPTPEPEPTFDPALFSDTDSLLIVANKSHKLPDGYVPADLVRPNITCGGDCRMREPAARAAEEMFAAAAEDGVYLKISSAYRGEDYQSALYWGYVGSYGVETADTISSRPGYSDHQTGLCADFIEGDGSMNGINFNPSFEDTASGTWLREHAHEYGFIMRYPKDKQDITGYAYEPWHYRYIGVEYATAIWEKDVFYSFEEYFGVTGGDYIEEPPLG